MFVVHENISQDKEEGWRETETETDRLRNIKTRDRETDSMVARLVVISWEALHSLPWVP